jgi:hypothetical protein
METLTVFTVTATLCPHTASICGYVYVFESGACRPGVIHTCSFLKSGCLQAGFLL